MKQISTIKKILFHGIAFLFAASAAAEEPITLEFWDFPHMPETSAWLQSAIGQFEQDNPGVKVRFTRLPWQDGQQKVTLAVLSGQPPDVCGQVSNNISQFVAQGVLEPVNDVIGPVRSDFHDSYIDAVSFKGDIYAIPWYKACYVMALNRELFDRFGVEPPREGRWTHEEFLEKMQALTRRAAPPDMRLDKTIGRAPTGETQYYGLVTNLGPAEYEAYSIIYNDGGRVLKVTPEGDIVPSVDQPDFIAGLKRLQDFDFRHGIAAPGIGAFTQEQSWKLWKESETVATTIQGGWIISALKKSNEQQTQANERLVAAGRPGETRKLFQWMLAAPPTADAQTTPVLASSGLGTFVVFRQEDERRRELAKKLAMHLVSGEGQSVLKYECVYPSRISAGNPYADDPMIGPIFALFPDAVVPPLIPGGERIDKVLQQEIQKALLPRPGPTREPQITAEEAARAGQYKVEAVLERATRRFGKAGKD